MQKGKLIKVTSKKCGVSRFDTTGVINATIETIGEILASGENIIIPGFISIKANGEVKLTKWFLDNYLKEKKLV